MDGIREAMAEAIQEAEEQETAKGPTQQAAGDASTSEVATTTAAQGARPETTRETALALANQERAEPMVGRMSLQRIHDALGRRFGNDILRAPAASAKVGGSRRDAE